MSVTVKKDDAAEFEVDLFCERSDTFQHLAQGQTGHSDCSLFLPETE